ncbi:MAG TPA: glycosyltransferase family 2 protein [Bryobacteraceae bacterium]|nr:glycosyltransferase family 2 protein [Bryobacteraceae bacterium]
MLGSALRSLLELTPPPGHSYDIVVVDDASPDDTGAVVAQASSGAAVEVRYVRHARNVGVAAARNTCVRHARGAWIAFFDDDQLADADWLVNLRATAERTGADCVAGPCVPVASGRPLPLSIRRTVGDNPLLRHRRRGDSLDPRRWLNPMPTAVGTGNVLIRKMLFEKIGAFSETLRRGEDMEFFLRADRQGAKIVTAPDAIIYHVVPEDRMTPEVLLSAATRGGAVRAEVELSVLGVRTPLLFASLRIARLMIWTLPQLVAQKIVDAGSSRLLGTRCAARFSLSYCNTVRQRVLSHRPQ